MEKLGKARVVVPLYMALYAATLWFTWFVPGWGNLALVVMDLLAIAVMLFATHRYIERYALTSWQSVWSWFRYWALVAIVMAIVHAIGIYMKDDETQRFIAFLPVTILLVVGVSYLLDKYKPDYRK